MTGKGRNMKGVGVFMLAATLAAAQVTLESKLRSIQSESREAATQGLDVLRGLVTDQNFRKYGFESAAETANATLGDPLVAFLVRLDSLRQYQGGRRSVRTARWRRQGDLPRSGGPSNSRPTGEVISGCR